MSRKRPSRHSEDQFALFLERIRDSPSNEDDAKFDKAVSNLVRRHKGNDSGQRRGVSDGAAPTGRDRQRPLPDKPVRSRAGKSDALTIRLGKLVIGWSDNESLLLQVLTLLLETDEGSAAAVQSVLNSTDVRLELIRRLVFLKIADPSLRQSLATALESVRKLDRAREECLRNGFANGKAQGGADPLQQVHQELHMLNRTLTDLVPQLRAVLGNR